MLQKLKLLFQQSFIYGIGNSLAKLSGIILLPLYFKYITPAEFGLITLFEVAFSFLLVVSGWGVKSGISRWYYEDDSETYRKTIFFTVYVFNAATSILFSGFFFVIGYFYSDAIFGIHLSDNTLIYFVLSTLFRLLFDVPFIVLKLQQKAALQTRYQVINILFTIILTFVLLEYVNHSLENIFLAQLIANGLSFMLVWPMAIRNSMWRFNFGLLKDMIHFGLPLAIANIISSLLILSDRFMLTHFFSLEETGDYGLAYKVSNLLQAIVVMSFITSYSNYYYKQINESSTSRFHLKIFSYFGFFMVFAGLALVAYSSEIIYLITMGKESYQSAIPLIPILIAGLLFSGLRQMLVLPLFKHKKTRHIMVVNILAGVVNLGLNFIFIPLLGKFGASWTAFSAQLVATIILYFLVMKFEPEKYEIVNLFKVLFVGFSYTFLFLYMPTFESWWLNISLRTLLLLTFPFILYPLKYYEQVEIERIKSIVKMFRNPKSLTKLKQGWKEV